MLLPTALAPCLLLSSASQHGVERMLLPEVSSLAGCACIHRQASLLLLRAGCAVIPSCPHPMDVVISPRPHSELGCTRLCAPRCQFQQHCQWNGKWELEMEPPPAPCLGTSGAPLLAPAMDHLLLAVPCGSSRPCPCHATKRRFATRSVPGTATHP